MKPSFLIEDSVFDEDINPIIDAVRQQGFDYKVVKYQPFESGSYKELFPADACVVFYGSINLARQLQRETNWIPGPICNFEMLRRSIYSQYYHPYLLDSEPIFMTWGLFKSLLRSRAKIIQDKATIGKVFIAPDTGLKTFTGQTIDILDYKFDLAYIDSRCRDENLIMVTTAAKMYHEYRLLVVDGKIITGTRYRWDGKLDPDSFVPQPVLDYANSMLTDTKGTFVPDIGFTLDFHMDNSNQVRLIECNAISVSGWYQSDANQAIEAISAVAIREWREYYNENYN